MIKNVIFDIGNVLTDFLPDAFFAAQGYPPDMVARLKEATVYREEWSQFDLGILSGEEVVEELAALTPELAPEIRSSLADIHGLVCRRDYPVRWIREVHESGRRAYYLSNFSEKARTECAEALDFISFMDGGIMSCDVHLLKPDPAIYRALLDQYGLQAEECVFMDDLVRNVEGAGKLGIHTIHFENAMQAKRELDRILNRCTDQRR